MSILERVQADTRAAMKAGERDRVGALRLLANALQQEAKLGSDDEVDGVAAGAQEAPRGGGGVSQGRQEDRAAAEEAESELIEAYLPEQLTDEELGELVSAAIDEAGASAPSEMGKVMSLVMPRVQGRADGKRVSGAVRDRLAGG